MRKVLGIVVVAVMALFTLVGSGYAQDQGNKDSLLMVVTPPNALDANPQMKAEVYIYADAQSIVSGSSGFKWDMPGDKAVMDTAFFAPEIVGFWNFIRSVYRGDNRDTTNKYNQFIMAGTRISGNGIPASPTRRLISTYIWSVPGWTNTDSVVFDTSVFSGGATLKFVALGNVTIIPNWGGKFVVRDPNAPSATIGVNPGSLTFNATEGGANPSDQTFDVTSSPSGVSFNATESAPWLTLTNASGNAPGTVTASVNITGLTPGTYNADITVNGAGATNNPQTVAVSLTVSASPKVLVVTPSTVNFLAEFGGPNPAGDIYGVSELGGGAINFTSTENTPWFSITGGDGVTPATPTVNVNIAGLAPGFYTDSITITSPGAIGSPQKAAVNLTITEQPALGVNPDSLTFNANVGGPNPSNQAFDVTSSIRTVDYNATENISWLSLTNASGNTSAGTVTASVDVTGLSAGTLVDTITVNGTGVSNSPQRVIVVLNLVEAAKTLVVTPGTLTFNAQIGGGNPAAQNYNVSELGGGTIAFTSAKLQSWLSITNGDGNTPASPSVAVDMTGLSAGVYVDTITVTSVGALESPKTIVVTFNLTAQPTIAVNPSVLNFSATEGGANPSGQTFDVTSQNGSVVFGASESATWITLGNSGGPTPGTVTVNVNIAGVTAGSYTDTITVVAAQASNSPQQVIVNLTVNAAPKTLVANPTSLTFVAEFDGSNPSDQLVDITELGGDAIDFAATENQTWLSLTGTPGTTPGALTAAVNISGLAVGVYNATIVVKSTEADSLLVPVQLTITAGPANYLYAQPTSFNLNFAPGDVPGTYAVLVQDSLSKDITFNVSANGNIALETFTGTTPENAFFTVDIAGLSSGIYADTIVITSSGAVNTVRVPVVYTIEACPELQISKTSSNVVVTVGDSVLVVDTVQITSTVGPVFWTVELSNGFGLSASGGTTPSVVTLTRMVRGTQIGEDTTCVTFATPEPGVEDEPNPCPSSVTYCQYVTTIARPSADSVIVGFAPAVPGMTVSVPVNFINSCDLTSMFACLTWDPTKLTLESVNYDGSRVSTIADKSEVINTDSGTVSLIVNVAQGEEVGSGKGLWANLVFSVFCETEPGIYTITTDDLDVPVSFGRNCGGGLETIEPTFLEGGVIIDTALNYVCGYVVDPLDNAIEGATVQLYADFPNGSAAYTTSSSSSGGFAFSEFSINPFDLYAYKAGYYPASLADLTFGEKGVKLVLRPLDDFTATSEWVDYYCDENTTFGAAMPVGSVVEAKTPNGLLVGQFEVTEAGKYGFMPVYRANDQFGDNGAVTGEVITFYINGAIAVADGDVVYPSEYAQKLVCLSAGGTVIKTCTLNEGWNLVSWNVNTTSDDIVDVLGPYMSKIDVVLGFEQGGLTYDPELPQFSTLWSVDHLSGYWIRVKAGQGFTLELEGTATPVSTPIALTTGWNLVSYLPTDVLTPAIGFASVENLLYAYGFANGIEIYQPNSQFNTLDELASCNAYWLKVSAADVLVYPGGNPVAVSRPNFASTAAASDVIPTTAWVNLYAENLQLDGSAVSAGSKITAHASNGNLIGSFNMTKDGQFGFMPVYADADGESVAGIKAGETFTLRVDGTETSEEFTWSANGDRVVVSNLSTSGGQVVPGSFSLEQNYPNPFNPTTNISFSLPEAGIAKLEVFNILGAQVATIFEGVAEAGSTTVVWDGKSSDGQQVGSGVYFYRLTSAVKIETKKMMLLK